MLVIKNVLLRQQLIVKQLHFIKKHKLPINMRIKWKLVYTFFTIYSL
jgi:hypothetical protein